MLKCHYCRVEGKLEKQGGKLREFFEAADERGDLYIIAHPSCRSKSRNALKFFWDFFASALVAVLLL